MSINVEDKRFRIEDSGSGYYEVLYMLSLLQRDNQGIVILDEPSFHLHPIKQKSFWKTISDWNDNQIIAVTHSPYLVNLNLFKAHNRLINIQMINGISKIYPVT